MKLGTTFSQVQCSYLEIDYKQAFSEVLTLGFDVIRICSYWNEIEPKKGKFNFEALDWLLDKAGEANVEIVLTVGIKAPRYPEFYLPDWLKSSKSNIKDNQPLDQNLEIRKAALNFIKQTLNHVKDYSSIKYIQVENEPLLKLEAVTNDYLSLDFLTQEVNLVKKTKSLDQKILLTNAIYLWPPDATEDSEIFEKNLEIGDCVGVNVYIKIPTKHAYYLEPEPQYWKKLQKWAERARTRGIEPWISESQAEPWEKDSYKNKPVHINKLEYPSINIQSAEDLVKKLEKLGYETILLWGCEYWYWYKTRGYNKWWEMIKELTKV